MKGLNVMNKCFKRIIASAMSVVTALSVTCTPIYAYSEKAISDEQYVMLQANRLMNSVNMDTLKEATENNIIDYSIPASIRDGIGANAEFIPVSGTSEDTLTMDVNSTVRKIGEVKNKAGKASNMYVTASVVSATVKENWDPKFQYDIKAWAFVYWIDNFGPNNELVAAAASWETGNVAVNSRTVTYGVSDAAALIWKESTTKSTSLNDVYYESDEGYVGYTLRCQSSINVVNKGTVICNTFSRITT